MAPRDGTFTIVQISDLHCGTQFFLPNLLERAITEVNDLQPEIVVVSGDLTTFVLEEDENGRIVEAFKPDFYLPEQDLYVEVTVMKQSLVTRKNRKLRKLRERYPDVRVKLFYKRDIERLAERYRLELAS